MKPVSHLGYRSNSGLLRTYGGMTKFSFLRAAAQSFGKCISLPSTILGIYPHAIEISYLLIKMCGILAMLRAEPEGNECAADLQ